MVHVVVRVWRLENSFGESILPWVLGLKTQVVGRAYQIVLLAEPANPDQEIFINPQLYCGKKVEYLVWWHPCTASMWQETTLRLRNTWAIYTLSRKLKHPWVSYPTHCSEEEVASLIWVQWRGCTRKWNFTLKRILSHRTGYIFFFFLLKLNNQTDPSLCLRGRQRECMIISGAPAAMLRESSLSRWCLHAVQGECCFCE